MVLPPESTPSGSRVVFHNLVVRQDLNGREGEIIEWLWDRNRYDVLVIGDPNEETVAVKPINLTLKADKKACSPGLKSVPASPKSKHEANGKGSSQKKVSGSGHLPRPKGRPPKNKRWDGVKGVWIPDGPEDVADSQATESEAEDDNNAEPSKPPPAKKPKPNSEGKKVKTEGRNGGNFHNRPRGKAPKGKEWNHATGQWVPDGAAPSAPRQPEKEKKARPRGRPPAGMAWNFETGEWEAEDGANDPLAEVAQDEEGEEEEGQEEEEEVEQDDEKGGDAAGSKARPRGRAPAGKVWNYKNGTWDDE